MAITPEQLAKPNTEHAHQVAFFCWASKYSSLRWMHAIPNGGEREIIVAGRLKAEGVKAGVWDVFVPVPVGQYHGCYIEMKRPGRENEPSGGVSPKQIEFGTEMHRQGYALFVCYSWEQARDAIRSYMGDKL